MSSFTVQKIIIQRKEKISILYKTLAKTRSPDIIIEIKSEIKEKEKELEYFEKMGVVH